MRRNLKRIAITTGDSDGIGLEVSVKALLKVGPRQDCRFLLLRFKNSQINLVKKLDSKFKRITVSSLSEALHYIQTSKPLAKNVLLDIESTELPPLWVEKAAVACHKGQLDGICTAPMSKELIYEAGLQDMGHTDILCRIAETKAVRMGFIGDHFNVVLATGHLPIKKVSEALTPETLKTALKLSHDLSKTLKLSKKPLALLGLNPHAGENGLIGDEEKWVMKDVLKWAEREKIHVEGPLTPDAAFFKSNWKKYACFVACYHDQGLIPFKMIHGQDSGCHVSLGLPFVRTSVDHGTAKDIFGRNKANPQSMVSALQFSIQLVR